MIIGGSKRQVIKNIKDNISSGTFNKKVEVNDAVLTVKESAELMESYLKLTHTFKYKFNNYVARQMAQIATFMLINKRTVIEGLDNIKGLSGGTIVTSNHFSPLENTVVRKTIHQISKKRLYIVSQDTNLLAPGPVGFLLKYYDTIPVSQDKEYTGREFPKQLQHALANNNFVLIYPEQEMWFNYRKPRPLKRGAYYYAASFNVPIISCFVEIVDLPEHDNAEFDKVAFKMHVLPPIFPNPQKSIRDNSIAMMQQDYEQKKKAYEEAYETKLDYTFTPFDIGGWRGGQIL